MTNYAIRCRIEALLATAAVCVEDARKANRDDLPNLTALDLRNVPRIVEEAVKLAAVLAERNEVARAE